MDDRSAQQPNGHAQPRDIAADILVSFALERRDAAMGASDRSQAHHDHETVKADSFDDLTGVYSRSAGFIELDRDIARAKRTGHPLTLVFVEVDELAALQAGERNVAEAAHVIAAHMRPYDLIIRSGEGAFVCAMSDFTPAEARERLVLVNAAFANSTGRRSLATGAVELRLTDSRDDVMARAFTAVSEGRKERRPAA